MAYNAIRGFKQISGGKGMHGTHGKYRSKTPPGEFTPKGGKKSARPPGSNKGPKHSGKPHAHSYMKQGRSTGHKSSSY